jgi:uncharacterized membrane protein
MKNRIWELDAVRGLCIWGMVLVHLVFDLTYLTGIVQWDLPDWFILLQECGGILFLMLSGICVTLGNHPIRRGLIVFGCGMLCTLVTYAMFLLQLSGSSMVIRFGVLHCLGLCMLLWPVFKNCSKPALLAIGLGIVALGLYFRTLWVDFEWLFPLGLRKIGFQSGDYFPLLPNFGYFLVGAALGKWLYREKKTLLPKSNPRNILRRFLCWTGRNSLWIYLAHQPLLAGLCLLLQSR